MRKSSRGNIGDILTMGMFVLAMAVVMISFINCMELLQIKEDVSQLARKYLLVIETEGYMTAEAENRLENELEELGVTEVSLDGTTMSRVGFGNVVTIKIGGKIKGGYKISEVRTSTAKY